MSRRWAVDATYLPFEWAVTVFADDARRGDDPALYEAERPVLARVNHVVVGSGLTGLVTASLLALRVDPTQVHVVEGAPVVGGLLRSFDHGDHGLFDVGTHLLSELGIPEVDEILLSALPDDEWAFHAGPHRDPAAIWCDGRLGSDSPYIDLRHLPRCGVRCTGELFDAVDDPVPPPGSDAGTVARARFGNAIVERAVGPAAQKVHRWPLDDLDSSALALTPLDRVVLFPEEPFGDLMASDLVRARVGYPSQWTMPDRFRSPMRALYPCRRGMQRFIDGLVGHLVARGVSFHVGSGVGSVEHAAVVGSRESPPSQQGDAERTEVVPRHSFIFDAVAQFRLVLAAHNPHSAFVHLNALHGPVPRIAGTVHSWNR